MYINDFIKKKLQDFQEVKHLIGIDYSRDELFGELGITRLKESYMREEEESPQDRLAFVSYCFSSDIEHAKRLYEYSSKHWLSYATPLLAFGKDNKSLPISCYLSYLDDSREGLVNTLAETSWLSMFGGGVGLHVGLRASDKKSVGIMPHLKMYDASTLAYKQAETRRGSIAAYLRIDHPDILNFLDMRKPTGDYNMRTLNLHHGICIPDSFMKIIEGCMKDDSFDDSWPLIDPHTKKVSEVVSAKYLWERILFLRKQTGEPFLFFIDTANKGLPDFLKEQGLEIHGTNLCTEIVLATNEERTAVCCLSSPNAVYFHQWEKIKTFIPDVQEMLGNAIDILCWYAPPQFERAKNSARRERSIGIGLVGLHSLFQSLNLPFESPMAIGLNRKIFKHIRSECERGDVLLRDLFGPCPDSKGTDNERTFSHWMAVAPNASTSIIMGNISPSIEPIRANIYRQDTLSGAYVNKNKYLEKLLREKGLDTEEVWSSIIQHGGSVQHLEELTDWEKDVFKTAMEINQFAIIQQAGDRQEYIDQAQSVNLFFKDDANIKYVHSVHYNAWVRGLKSLYYLRSTKARQAESIGAKVERVRIEEEFNLNDVLDKDACIACEG